MRHDVYDGIGSQSNPSVFGYRHYVRRRGGRCRSWKTTLSAAATSAIGNATHAARAHTARLPGRYIS